MDKLQLFKVSKEVQVRKGMLIWFVLIVFAMQWGCGNGNPPAAPKTAKAKTVPTEKKKTTTPPKNAGRNSAPEDPPDTDTESEAEKKWHAMRVAARQRAIVRSTARYRIRTRHSNKKLNQLWNRLKSRDICLHGGAYLSDNKQYDAAKAFIYNIDDGILDFLATRLAKRGRTSVHTSAAVGDNALEYGLAWVLLEERTQSIVEEYDGDDPLIRNLLEWLNKEMAAGDSAPGYVFLDIQDQIVSSKASREALVAYFKKMQAKNPIKEVEADFADGLIPFSKFQGDPRRLKKLKVAFPVLEANTESSCPLPKEELFGYLRANYVFDETSDLKELHFLRTAQVASDRYWVWQVEKENLTTVCWVVQPPSGEVYIGTQENDAGWTLEQFLLGDYYGMVHFFLEEPP